MKVLNFKSIEPFFSQERDGEKPFTTRRIDPKDKRFRALSQWKSYSSWAMRITNPGTGESFVRTILGIDRLRYLDHKRGSGVFYESIEGWLLIILGDKVK